MRFARACNSRMYRSPLLSAMMLTLLIGCNKSTEEAEPAEPEVTPEPEKTNEPEVAKEEKAPDKEEAAPDKAETLQTVLVKDVGFKSPESVYYDEKNDVYLVSNINGSPSEADNNGFISKINPQGEVVALTWIQGGQNDVTLNAPKGMTVKDDVLYVTDIDTVRMFDMTTGAAKGEVAIKGATFLNDLTSNESGTIYVSDSGQKADENGVSPTGTDAIWTIKDGKAKKLIAGKKLNRPNGLLADEGGVWVVTNAGTELYRVTDDGKKETPTTIPSGSLDGLARTGDGNLLISSWEAQTVFQGKPEGTFSPVLADVTSPADIGYDTKRNRLLVPIFQEDALRIEQLSATALRSDAPEPETAASKADDGEPSEKTDETTEGEKPTADKPEEATATKKAASEPTTQSDEKKTASADDPPENAAKDTPAKAK